MALNVNPKTMATAAAKTQKPVFFMPSLLFGWKLVFGVLCLVFGVS
jgi:hypothetical protein